MRIYISKDGEQVHEIKVADEFHVSHWKHLVITYLNFQTKPFSKCLTPGEWDTIIVNKKVD